jgi:hypothetical protein
MPPIAISVIGDCQVDALFHEKPSALPDDPVALGTTKHVAPPFAVLQSDGGATFVAAHVRAAIASLKLGRRAPSTSGPDFPDRFAQLQFPIVAWDLVPVTERKRTVCRLRNPRRLVPSNEEFKDEQTRLTHDRGRFPSCDLDADADALVFDDMGICFRYVTVKNDAITKAKTISGEDRKSVKQNRAKYVQFLDEWLANHQASNRGSLLFGILGARLPADGEPTVWDKILAALSKSGAKSESVILINANDLRDSGVRISTGLSWERTAEDIVTAFTSHSVLSRFNAFRHIIVRFGTSGAIHSFSGLKGREYTLFFNPGSSDNELEESDSNGTVLGYNTIVAATILQQLLKDKTLLSTGDRESTRRSIGEGIRSGIARCRERFELGYGEDFVAATEWTPWNEKGRWKKLYSTASEDHSAPLWIADVPVPATPGMDEWSILWSSCGFDSQKFAHEIVTKGVKQVFSPETQGTLGMTLPAPIVQFGMATFVDRTEIESFRTVRNLIERHYRLVNEKRAERPLSIAVFGPPGSGKSFGVKNVVDAVIGGTLAKPLPFNLTQMATESALDQAFQKVSEAILDGHMPVVFFDEFDASMPQGGPLGWLKLFLAPMEDGRYRGSKVTNAIFVFAGGTSRRFADFSGLEQTNPVVFSAAKGTDFVSRLHGHVDILGVNRMEDREDHTFMLRRAVTLRGAISRLQKLQDGQIAEIDADLLKALLRVSEYKHGARSLRAVLELCSNKWGHIRKSAMPTLAQLKMHLDGETFMQLVNSGHV